MRYAFRSLDTQRNGNLFNRFLHVFLGSRGQAGHRLLEETLRRAELLIGHHLFLMPVATASESEPEFLGGVFDLLHGADAMALVVVVSRRQSGIRLAQQAGVAGG